MLKPKFQRMSASVSEMAPQDNDLTLREKRVYADDYSVIADGQERHHSEQLM